MRDRAREKWLFEECPVWESVLRLAFPTVIGQIILVIYNLADTFFIGLTGDNAKITAVTVCMPAFMFLSAISNLFGVGGSSAISRALGRGDRKRAAQASAFALWGCIAVTVLYSLGAYLARHTFIDLLGGCNPNEPSLHDYAVHYLMVTVVLGGFGTTMNTLMGHLVRSEGRSVHDSAGIALGGVLNIALDPLFMFVILPKGNEVLGAAIATALSNLLAMVYFILVLYFTRKSSTLRFSPTRKMLEKGLVKDIISTGLPACLMTLCENISYAILDKLMSLYQAVAMQTGIGLAKKVNMLAHCMVRGMSQGVLPLIGYNYAAGNHARMRKSVLLSTGVSVLLASLCMAASLLLSHSLISIFISEEAAANAQQVNLAVDYGAKFLRILCIGGPFSACAYAFISFFQATGEGLKSFLLAILRKGVLDIPLMFALNRLLPVFGIVWATPIADIVCCVTAIVFFVRFLGSHRPALAE